MTFNSQSFQTLLLLLKLFLFVCMLIVVVIASISYGFIQKRTDEIESNDVVVQEQLFDVPIESSKVLVSPKISVIVCNDCCNDDVTQTRPQQSLLCYCDGSYSNGMQIGYSGFRASDGFIEFRFCPIRRPRSGSTESEVFAAYLALRYTAKCHFNSMTLHTDNSKVEQLFKYPKPTDYTNYPDFFDALSQCRQNKEDYVDIQVKRVRGHTTRYEQQQCPIKREFAIVDRQVRQKLRQHIGRIYSSYEKIHSFYRCSTKNSRNIHTVDFGTMFMMNSIPKMLSYC